MFQGGLRVFDGLKRLTQNCFPLYLSVPPFPLWDPRDYTVHNLMLLVLLRPRVNLIAPFISNTPSSSVVLKVMTSD